MPIALPTPQSPKTYRIFRDSHLSAPKARLPWTVADSLTHWRLDQHTSGRRGEVRLSRCLGCEELEFPKARCGNE